MSWYKGIHLVPYVVPRVFWVVRVIEVATAAITPFGEWFAKFVVAMLQQPSRIRNILQIQHILLLWHRHNFQIIIRLYLKQYKYQSQLVENAEAERKSPKCWMWSLKWSIRCHRHAQQYEDNNAGYHSPVNNVIEQQITNVKRLHSSKCYRFVLY